MYYGTSSHFFQSSLNGRHYIFLYYSDDIKVLPIMLINWGLFNLPKLLVKGIIFPKPVYVSFLDDVLIRSSMYVLEVWG